jgi:hypothetical protein
MECERFEAGLPMCRATGGAELTVRKDEGVPLAGVGGIHDPAGQATQARFGVHPLGQAVPVEQEV